MGCRGFFPKVGFPRYHPVYPFISVSCLVISLFILVAYVLHPSSRLCPSKAKRIVVPSNLGCSTNNGLCLNLLSHAHQLLSRWCKINALHHLQYCVLWHGHSCFARCPSNIGHYIFCIYRSPLDFLPFFMGYLWWPLYVFGILKVIHYYTQASVKDLKKGTIRKFCSVRSYNLEPTRGFRI